MFQSIDELDPTATLARIESNVREQRAVELEGLHLLAHWADLHRADPQDEPDAIPVIYGGDKLVQLGGPGTPEVAELCLPEAGVARGVHTLSVRATTADVLDLQHRLRSTWAVVEDLACPAWLARRVAFLTRHLTPETAAIVDTVVARAIRAESPGRVLRIVEATIIEVDQPGHAAKLDAERRRRHVSLTRTDEHGLRSLIARIEAGDAVWVDAMINRVADILATHPDLRPDTPTVIGKDELRSIAFGWLARPAELLTLLLDHATPPEDSEPAEDSEPESVPSRTTRAMALSERALRLLTSTDLSKLRPSVTLYIHLHQAAVDGATGGVARVEQLGPMLLDQVRRLLTHANVVVKPVIDLHDQVSVNAYEHPATIKERVHLRSPGEVFPHATRISRNVDLDHPVPWDPDGPPGQTGDHNAAPLGRTNHRAKTHLGYHLAQTGLGEYVWTTPHGLHRHVDNTGTHHIDTAQALELTHPGVLDQALDKLMREYGLSQGPVTAHHGGDPARA